MLLCRAPPARGVSRRHLSVRALAASVTPRDIRNVSIVAHVDHGKSTLADRIMEFTGALDSTRLNKQVLDSLNVERERGITVKAQTAALEYRGALINLIDTPGHADFSFEVSRSLRASQGALLLVDSTQGVEAQTVANHEVAKALGMDVIPVLTKLDLSHSDPSRALQEILSNFGYTEESVVWTSAKTGEGVEEVLDAVLAKVRPPPCGVEGSDVSAILVDSWHDKHRGVVCLVSVLAGTISKNTELYLSTSGKKFTVGEVGLLTPYRLKIHKLRPGCVGVIYSNLKNVRDAAYGDSISSCVKARADTSLGTLRQTKKKSTLFCSVFPVDTADFAELSSAIERLELNDPSVDLIPTSSESFGRGYRCGFLGTLHMEVFFQRLEDEHATAVVASAASVTYKALMKDGTEVLCELPSDLPPRQDVLYFEEPIVTVTILAPSQHTGALMEALHERRGDLVGMSSTETDTKLVYTVPWQETVADLDAVVKSATSGYAKFSYEESGFQRSNIVKLDILLNGEIVDALSTVCHSTKARRRGKLMVAKLKEVVPRSQFEIIVQASANGKIVARETIKALRKNVLVKSGKKVGGGDVSRKKKLLDKQKRGKAALKTVSAGVKVSSKALMSIFEVR